MCTVAFRNCRRHARQRRSGTSSLPGAATDIPRGILLNDQVDNGEPGAVRKQVAIFGLFPETLPGVASGAIAANAESRRGPDDARVREGSADGGGHVTSCSGRARFRRGRTRVIPVSIIHGVPRVVTVLSI